MNYGTHGSFELPTQSGIYKYTCVLWKPIHIVYLLCSISKACVFFVQICRLKKSLLSVDVKCDDGCWYCTERCQHCLQPAMLGNSLRNIKGEVIKFCKINPCYVFYTSSPDNTPSVIFPLPHDVPSDSELLLQITKLIGTGWSSNTVLVIQLCINTKSFDEHKGELYVLMQFRTFIFQSFFDFFITKDYKPFNVLPYMKHKKLLIMKNSTLFMLMLKFIIEDALQATSHCDLDTLLRTYHQSCAVEIDSQCEAARKSGKHRNIVTQCCSIYGKHCKFS